MKGQTQNLDYLAASYSQTMVTQLVETDKIKPSEADNLFTKALGVLQGQGLYAMALYLLYRSGDRTGGDMSRCSAEELAATTTMAELWGMLRNNALTVLEVTPSQRIGRDILNLGESKDAILKHFSDTLCASDLGRMLFIKELFQQTLIYARYHARGKPEPASATGTETAAKGEEQ